MAHVEEDEFEGMENDPEIERKGIMKAIEYSEWHWTEITRYGHDLSAITYTDNDRRLYQAFRSNFEDLEVSIVYDDDIKSDIPKIRWREFMLCQEGLVEEYNAITLLRTDCRKDYDQDNSILVPRIQFLCIEISRAMECCNIGLADRPVLFKIFQDKKLNADKVIEKLSSMKNQLMAASERGYLAILQEISQIRFLTREMLGQTGIGRVLTDLVKKTRNVAVTTAARAIVGAWKEDLKFLTEHNATVFNNSSDNSMSEHVNKTQLYSWMSFSTPLYVAKKKIMQKLLSNVPGIQVFYTDMQPTGNNTNGIFCEISQKTPLPTELLNIFRIERLSFLELKKLSQDIQEGKIDPTKDIFISDDNEYEVVVESWDKFKTLYSNCHDYHQQVILRGAIKQLEAKMKNVGLNSEESQAFRSKGISLSLLPPVKPLEFELEMYLILPALENKINDILNNLPAELQSKNKNLDSLWLELYNQMYSAEMLNVSTKVGVAQQDRDAADPTQYQNDETARIVSEERVQELLTKGIVVIDGAMSESDTSELHSELTTLVEEGHMVPTFQENSSTRFDKICWLSENSTNVGDLPRPLLKKAILLLKGIANELCKKAHMKLKVPTVSMSAVYDGDGAHYVAHRDNVCTPQCLNSREITCIIYPNPGWKNSYGGQLRCYMDADDSDATGLTSKAPIDVYPEGGRLVIFNSQKMLHEVMPSYHRRFAVSLWILGENIIQH